MIGNPEKSANSRFSIPKVLERNNKIQKNFVILSGSTMQSVRREESIYLKYSQFIMLIFTSKLKHRGRYGFIQSDKISIVNRLFDCTFALRASGMLRVTNIFNLEILFGVHRVPRCKSIGHLNRFGLQF